MNKTLTRSFAVWLLITPLLLSLPAASQEKSFDVVQLEINQEQGVVELGKKGPKQQKPAKAKKSSRAKGKSKMKRSGMKTVSKVKAKKGKKKKSTGRKKGKYKKKAFKKKKKSKNRTTPSSKATNGFRSKGGNKKNKQNQAQSYLQNKIKQKQASKNTRKASSRVVKKAAPNKVNKALQNFKTQNYKFGNHSFKLDKKDMKHILERHHPSYWNGTKKQIQTFFNKNMTPSGVQRAVQNVMKQNQVALKRNGTNGVYQISGTYQGQKYTLGINNGRVAQFYPN